MPTTTTTTTTTATGHAANEEIYCLLVPLAEDRLLLPRSCVTEVLNYQAPTPMDGAPPWYLGTIAWGGRRVPLVAFEATLGKALPRTSGRTRIVVMQGLSGKGDGNFAVLTQGFPQLVRLSSDVIHADDSRSFNERMPVIGQVRMINEYPLIPDFERLEDMIEEETRV
ncbi:MAG TPA: chemotaxis protein CheW [Steroidobacteraceae bacterium]|nr:chemotaxis protein CheW [Steroidobacteraceae bacterium]